MDKVHVSGFDIDIGYEFLNIFWYQIPTAYSPQNWFTGSEI
jgi:hypothetical protein